MTTSTLTLSAFLLARIEEDEAVARRSGKTWNTLLHKTPRGSAEHVSRWSPYEVLRECEVKRAIVERHSQCDDVSYGDASSCPDMRSLASLYAYHADYRAGWAL